MNESLNQEVVEITEELSVVMRELGLTSNHIAAGLRRGYRAERIDESRPIAPGNIIWAQGFQIDAFRAWADREIANTFGAPASGHARSLADNTKGALAYRRRTSGETWHSIGLDLALAQPLQTAKNYAKTRGLDWPIVR